MKKLLSVILSAFIFVIPVVNAIAIDEDKIISPELYSELLQAEADKYDIKISLSKNEQNPIFTIKDLEDSKSIINSMSKMSVKQTETFYNTENDIVVKGLMPVDVTRTASFYIYCNIGNANMKLTATATKNAQDNSIINIGSSSAYQSGSYSNFKSWTTKSITTRSNYPQTGYVEYCVKGTAVYEKRTIGGTTGFTQDVVEYVNINFK